MWEVYSWEAWELQKKIKTDVMTKVDENRLKLLYTDSKGRSKAINNLVRLYWAEKLWIRLDTVRQTNTLKNDMQPWEFIYYDSDEPEIVVANPVVSKSPSIISPKNIWNKNQLSKLIERVNNWTYTETEKVFIEKIYKRSWDGSSIAPLYHRLFPKWVVGWDSQYAKGSPLLYVDAPEGLWVDRLPGEDHSWWQDLNKLWDDHVDDQEPVIYESQYQYADDVFYERGDGIDQEPTIWWRNEETSIQAINTDLVRNVSKRGVPIWEVSKKNELQELEANIWRHNRISIHNSGDNLGNNAWVVRITQ